MLAIQQPPTATNSAHNDYSSNVQMS